MHFYLIYSICRPPKVIVRGGHKIMLNFFKKKDLPTYLPKLKLMGRSTANKYILKDGLRTVLQDEMKKVNKQCLLDTPRTERVSDKTWQVIVQTRRP